MKLPAGLPGRCATLCTASCCHWRVHHHSRLQPSIAVTLGSTPAWLLSTAPAFALAGLGGPAVWVKSSPGRSCVWVQMQHVQCIPQGGRGYSPVKLPVQVCCRPSQIPKPKSRPQTQAGSFVQVLMQQQQRLGPGQGLRQGLEPTSSLFRSRLDCLQVLMQQRHTSAQGRGSTLNPKPSPGHIVGADAAAAHPGPGQGQPQPLRVQGSPPACSGFSV